MYVSSAINLVYHYEPFYCLDIMYNFKKISSLIQNDGDILAKVAQIIEILSSEKYAKFQTFGEYIGDIIFSDKTCDSSPSVTDLRSCWILFSWLPRIDLSCLQS